MNQSGSEMSTSLPVWMTGLREFSPKNEAARFAGENDTKCGEAREAFAVELTPQNTPGYAWFADSNKVSATPTCRKLLTQATLRPADLLFITAEMVKQVATNNMVIHTISSMRVKASNSFAFLKLILIVTSKGRSDVTLCDNPAYGSYRIRIFGFDMSHKPLFSNDFEQTGLVAQRSSTK